MPEAVDVRGWGGRDDFKRDRPAPNPTPSAKAKAETVRAAFDALKTKPAPSGGGRELTRPIADELPPAPDELAPFGNGGALTRKFDVRCSEEDVARWRHAAETSGVSISEFLRDAANERASGV